MKFDVLSRVAQHLVSTYGGRAEDVLNIDMKPFQSIDRGALHNHTYIHTYRQTDARFLTTTAILA